MILINRKWSVNTGLTTNHGLVSIWRNKYFIAFFFIADLEKNHWKKNFRGLRTNTHLKVFQLFKYHFPKTVISNVRTHSFLTVKLLNKLNKKTHPSVNWNWWDMQMDSAISKKTPPWSFQHFFHYYFNVSLILHNTIQFHWFFTQYYVSLIIYTIFSIANVLFNK